jgi:hypothetical protein
LCGAPFSQPLILSEPSKKRAGEPVNRRIFGPTAFLSYFLLTPAFAGLAAISKGEFIMRSKYDVETVKSYFEGTFEPGSSYDGGYHTDTDWSRDEQAQEAFRRLTDRRMSWCQVHGDFKSAVKAAMFQPYAHWPQLYECARDIVEQHRRLNTSFHGDITCAKLMGDTMALLRARYKLNVPKWWLPIMNDIRGRKAKPAQPAHELVPYGDGGYRWRKRNQ